jgi:branched-chain amino acid transport system permease protein
VREGWLRDLALAAAAFALFLVLAASGSPALLDFAIRFAIFGLLAMSLNLLIGTTGLVSFGHAAYFAMGAYGFGLAMQRLSLPPAMAIPLAMLLALARHGAAGASRRRALRRLSEIYFAFSPWPFRCCCTR